MELPELLLALDEVESLEREEVEERLMVVSMEGIEFSVFLWLSIGLHRTSTPAPAQNKQKKEQN